MHRFLHLQRLFFTMPSPHLPSPGFPIKLTRCAGWIPSLSVDTCCVHLSIDPKAAETLSWGLPTIWQQFQGPARRWNAHQLPRTFRRLLQIPVFTSVSHVNTIRRAFSCSLVHRHESRLINNNNSTNKRLQTSFEWTDHHLPTHELPSCRSIWSQFQNRISLRIGT